MICCLNVSQWCWLKVCYYKKILFQSCITISMFQTLVSCNLLSAIVDSATSLPSCLSLVLLFVSNWCICFKTCVWKRIRTNCLWPDQRTVHLMRDDVGSSIFCQASLVSPPVSDCCTQFFECCLWSFHLPLPKAVCDFVCQRSPVFQAFHSHIGAVKLTLRFVRCF